MITLSENARKALDAYFAGKEKESIRIYLAPGGWSGPRLGLALDEPGDKDSVVNESGFTFCIDKELLKKVQGVSLDVNYMGFIVKPDIPLIQQGSSCGSCAGSASCSV